MIKVTLRKKEISGNRQSLYLDYYPPIPHPETGNPTRREFLNLYLFNEIEIAERKYFDKNGKEQTGFVPVLNKKGKPKKVKLNPFDKLHNKETLQLAEQVKQKRENHINKPEIYNEQEKKVLRLREQGERNFIEYFKQLADKRKYSSYFTWYATLQHLKAFTNGNARFADLTEKFCNDFKDYLLNAPSRKSSKTTLSHNSAVCYFNRLKTALIQAYKDGYLSNDLNLNIEALKPTETQRNFLTIEELNQLVKTDCRHTQLKKAALFSALTGLRFSDIQKLVWGELEYIEGQGYFIQFKQQKTKGVEVLPISEQAYSLLGERKEPTDKVFEGLAYSAYYNKNLFQWIARAGITKDITFHSFRHTYAVLQLSKGTDIYTVSKMLGHRELKTTQIYAKVMDKAKREAADKIQLNF